MRKFMLILLPLFIAACAASGEQRDKFDEMAVYDRHAGATQSWVRYTSIRNWYAVGFHAVVFEMDRNRHYLVELIGPCDLDLDSAIAMRLVNTRRNVLSEFDRVVVGGQQCQIQSIRRLDLEAVQAELEDKDRSLPDGQGSLETETDQPSGGT
ncbi:MAG: DUF6491 family protein [Wenzhouxiangella sp.]|jgi:hypothetical protein|nr:DUF6491 family protein [Wenzhouxiangella sp.]